MEIMVLILIPPNRPAEDCSARRAELAGAATVRYVRGFEAHRAEQNVSTERLVDRRTAVFDVSELAARSGEQLETVRAAATALGPVGLAEISPKMVSGARYDVALVAYSPTHAEAAADREESSESVGTSCGLLRRAATARSAGAAVEHAIVAGDDPRRVLLESVHEHGFDLIVVGHHRGRRPPAHGGRASQRVCRKRHRADARRGGT
jgi:nucleotide-binding universal stress UspA family protein